LFAVLLVLSLLAIPATAKTKRRRKAKSPSSVETTTKDDSGTDTDVNIEFDETADLSPPKAPPPPPLPTIWAQFGKLFTGLNLFLAIMVFILGFPFVVKGFFGKGVKYFKKGDRIIIVEGKGKNKRGEVTKVFLATQVAEVVWDGKKKARKVRFAFIEMDEKYKSETKTVKND